jgi:oligosaccharide repeat unit polymerase
MIYLVSLYISFYNSKHIDDALLFKILFVSLISIVLFLFREEDQEYLKGNRISLPLFFLIGYLPTCLQYYLRYIFDNSIDLALGYELSMSVINKSAIVSAIGLLCFLFGYLMPTKVHHNNTPSTTYPTKELQIIAILLFVVYIIFIPKDYFMGNNTYYSNEGSIGVIATYSARFCAFANTAVIALSSWNGLVKTLNQGKSLSLKDYTKEYRPLFLITMFIYLGLNIMSGDRGCIFSTIIPFAVGFMLATRKKIKLGTIMILGVVAIASFYFLGYFRAMDTSLSVTDRYQEATSIMSNQNLWDVTGELAVVIRAQHALFMYVEDHGFMYFTPLIYSLLGIIPGAGFIFTTLIGQNQDTLVSAKIATNYMGADHGMGTTCVGDWYISFGVVTVIIFMVLLGYVYRIVANKTASFSMWGSLVFMYFLVTSPGIARETVFMLFRNCVFLMIIVYFNNRLFTKQKRNGYSISPDNQESIQATQKTSLSNQ